MFSILSRRCPLLATSCPSFSVYFLSVLFCLLSMLISDSQFDLVWFRLSCDHGWIRSGSVNVRKKKTIVNEHARARLLWAILSLVLPFTFRHTAACYNPDMAFSAAINFAMKRSAPFSAVLRHFLSSWAADVHWSALMPKALRSSRKHPIHSFPAPPRSPRPPRILRTSRTSAVSYPPCAPQIPRTRSASCVKSPRCSRFPSS